MADNSSFRQCLVSAVLLVLLVLTPVQDTFRGDLGLILDGLLRQELRHGVRQGAFPRVAVGFGSCKDVVALDGVLVLERAGLSPPSAPHHHGKLSTADEVSETFAYFIRHGAAAE